MRRALLGAGLAVGLASCSSGAPGPPEDQALGLSLSAGDGAMALGRPADAVRNYGDAYHEALARDDAEALGTAGIDLVIALTEGDQPASALSTAGTVRAALERRRTVIPYELDLAQAAALLRLDRPAEASTLTERAENASSAEVAARAAFLRGFAAALLGQTDRLASSLARLGQGAKVSLTWQADRAELGARLQLATGRAGAALARAQQAAQLRRAALDYRGMRRALRLGSLAASRMGDPALAIALETEASESARSSVTRSVPSRPDVANGLEAIAPPDRTP